MRRPFEQNTGDPEAVKLVKQRFGLEEHGAEESKAQDLRKSYVVRIIVCSEGSLEIWYVKAIASRVYVYMCMPQVRILMRRPFEQNTGDPEAVKLVKQRFGLEEHAARCKTSRVSSDL
jgi:hypothetical protein